MGHSDSALSGGNVPAAAAAASVDEGGDIHHRIGHLTRTLHDALRGLGYDRELMDARDRLAYIARVTGEAAEKVLNSVDRARTVQQELATQAINLRTRWQTIGSYTASGKAATPAGKQLIDETSEFFSSVGGQADRTNAILTDIMMAQDFHDLTGQVIRRVVVLAQSLEDQLLKLLIETTPAEQRARIEVACLEGPVMSTEGRADVVADQQGVDDLLASLGF